MPFAPGKSGNPGGRPKAVGGIRELARKYDKAAIAVLAELMNNASTPAAARIMAANSLLDRGCGKPMQPIGGDESAPPIIREHRTAVLADIARIIAAKRSRSGADGDG